MADENWEYGRVRWIERPTGETRGEFLTPVAQRVLQQERWQVWGESAGPREWVDVEIENES